MPLTGVFERCQIQRALLVEGQEMLRQVTAAQLRDAGAEQVVAVSRIMDAREHLERDPFDLVICSNDLQDNPGAAQDLLDELRREQLLPPSTVFIMVSTEATYQSVAEAGEASIDGYLVRPYTTETLAQRLRESVQRRRTLSPIFEAINRGQLGAALMRALLRFQRGERYAYYSGRLAAELLLRFQRPEDAAVVFQRIADRRPAEWARLGVARALSAMGDLKAARTCIEEIQQRVPDSADAHELMGQVLIEHGELGDALSHCMHAAQLTPGCVIRCQIAATLCFYMESPERALPMLLQSCRTGARSRLFNPLIWVLLGMARWASNDTKGVQAAAQGLTKWQQSHPDDPRGQRWQTAMRAVQALARQDPVRALDETRRFSQQADTAGFDLEAANVMLSLWGLLKPDQWPETERRGLAQTIGLRLGVSKSTTELMCAAAAGQAQVVAALRQAQSTITQYAQRCVERSAGRDVTNAVIQVLELAEATHNARLFELAGLTLKRHEARIRPPERLAELGERAARGLLEYAGAVSHIAGVQRPGRSAAGVPLRGWTHETSIKALLPSLASIDEALRQHEAVIEESADVPTNQSTPAVAR